MSEKKNQTRKPVDGNNEGSKAPAKKNVFVRIVNAGKRKYLEFKATKVGRIVIGGAKLTAGGVVLYETFKAGQRSVKPTVVAITSGDEPETDDAPVEEPEETEEVDEPVDEQA